MTERLLAIDPGDPHVGLAMWQRETPDDRWVCTQAKEVTPDEFRDIVQRFTSQRLVGRVGYEVFRLAGGQEAAQQKGSTFKTVEVIGIARGYCESAGISFDGCERGERRATLKRMRAIGWRFPPGSPTHVKDAIAVGATLLGWRAANHVEGDGVRPLTSQPMR